MSRRPRPGEDAVIVASRVVASSPLAAAAVAWRRGWMPLGDGVYSGMQSTDPVYLHLRAR